MCSSLRLMVFSPRLRVLSSFFSLLRAWRSSASSFSFPALDSGAGAWAGAGCGVAGVAWALSSAILNCAASAPATARSSPIFATLCFCSSSSACTSLRAFSDSDSCRPSSSSLRRKSRSRSCALRPSPRWPRVLRRSASASLSAASRLSRSFWIFLSFSSSRFSNRSAADSSSAFSRPRISSSSLSPRLKIGRTTASEATMPLLSATTRCSISMPLSPLSFPFG